MSDDRQNTDKSQYRGLRPWQPGQSGNPSGRPKGIAALCREHTPEALATLLRALQSDDERVAVTAATVIIERGWGKVPPTQTDPENPTGYVIRGPSVVNSVEEWLKLRPQQRVIDADVHEG